MFSRVKVLEVVQCMQGVGAQLAVAPAAFASFLTDWVCSYLPSRGCFLQGSLSAAQQSLHAFLLECCYIFTAVL
jgi:hypothetical protein